MATRKVAAGRDWEAVRQLMNEIRGLPVREKDRAAQQQGFLNFNSMQASLWSYEHRTKPKSSVFHVKTETEEAVPVGRVLDIPEDIQRQLIAVEWLPVNELIVDKRFQREEDSERIRKMASEWEWLACRQLAVSLRQGAVGNYYSLVDGQQRAATIRFMGYEKAPCNVYVDLTFEQEALLFEKLNQNKKPGFNDLFKSRLARGDEKAKAINIAVESVGYHLDPGRTHSSRTAKDGHFYIQSMREVERIYDDYGGKTSGVIHLMDTLKLIRDVWAPEDLNQQAMILAGTAHFLHDYRNQFNRSELVQKLRKIGQMKVTQLAFQWQAVHGSRGTSQGGGSGRGKAFCEAMLSVYNQNRQEANRIKSKNV